ncbi:MAG: thermonuclease family protein [Clostridia bacterium]
MYYKSKQTFYLIQYGPKVFLLSIFAIALLLGSYMFLKTNNVNDKTIVKAVYSLSNRKAEVLEEHASKEVSTEANTSCVLEGVFNKENTLIDTDYKDLSISKLEQGMMSSAFKVVSVNDVNNITIEDKDGSHITISMIGVMPTASLDLQSSEADLYKKELSSLLKDKNVQVKFDKKKTENNLYFAYVYYNKDLVNAKLLENGYSKVKEEKQNVEIQQDLLQAEKKAKDSVKGIWHN